MAKFKTGDVFTFQLENGNYLCGRILLDINKQCVKTKLSEYFSVFFNRSIVIEIYRELSESPIYNKSGILIPGCFADTRALKDGDWQVISNDPVDPEEVEFPEGLDYMKSDNDFMFFRRGEVSIKLPAQNKYKNVHIRTPIKNSYGMAECCEDLLNGENPLINSDLRFTNYRSEIYKLLGEDEKISYYDFSKKHGFDISRFY